MDFRKEFVKILLDMMDRDKKIILLSGDLGFGILEIIKEKYPNRFINCGIAECNMIGVASGLALGGFKPYVYSNTIFLLMRGYEFIRDEVCYNNRNVKLIGTGASGFLGFSHNLEGKENEYDLLKNLPNIKYYEPKSGGELGDIMLYSYSRREPAYIKL